MARCGDVEGPRGPRRVLRLPGTHCRRTCLWGGTDDNELLDPTQVDCAALRFPELYASFRPEMVRRGRLLGTSRTAGEEAAQEACLGPLETWHRVGLPRQHLRESVGYGVRNHQQELPRELLLDQVSDWPVQDPKIDLTRRLLAHLLAPASNRRLTSLRRRNPPAGGRARGRSAGAIKSARFRALRERERMRRERT